MNTRAQRPSLARQFTGFIGWLGLTFGMALLAAIASAQADTFYLQLERPPWAPPAWLFSPVWTALYLMMAVAVWLAWREGGFRLAPVGMGLFIVQLAANALWTWLFFVWQLGAWAFAEILVLWLLIAATVVAFWRVRPLAGALLLPYLAWVTLACALTWSTWQRNPGVLG